MEDIIDNKIDLLFGITEAITGATERGIKSPLRDRHLSLARQVMGYILNIELGLTVMRVGEILNRDHSTITFYTRYFDDKFEWDKDFREAYTLVSETFWGNYEEAERNDIDLQVMSLQNLIDKLERKKQILTKNY